VAIWNRLQSILFGGAIGAASSDAIRPVLEPVRQQAWLENQHKVLDPGTAAELAAKGVIPEGEAVDEAARNGIGGNRLDALIALSQTYPGLADLDKLSNRELIGPELVELALARHGIPKNWHPALVALFSDLLSVADVAAGVQQGHLPNPGILPDVTAAVSPAQGSVTPIAPDQQPPSTVPLTQIDLDPIQEAAGGGIDLDRLKVIANLSGLPPGAAELLTMWNRELIDEASVDAGLREGHLKTKWSGAFKRLRWNVLGAAEYASAHLRGWIDQDTMYKGGALTGHTTDQMDLLYLNRGRPLAPVQAFTAWARAAPHPVGEGYTDRPGTFDQEDFQRAIQQSDVRTEYGPILWHNRYAYPPLFQLGRLAQAGALPENRVRTILQYERYEPEDIDALVAFWYGKGSASTAATPTTKAENQLWTATHRSYVGQMSGVTEAKRTFDLLAIPAAEQAKVLEAWDEERALIRKQLTPAQIKKAVQGGLPNIDTGQAWTVSNGVDALVARGYSLNDAQTFLSE
jgi:hypothetical protein